MKYQRQIYYKSQQFNIFLLDILSKESMHLDQDERVFQVTKNDHILIVSLKDQRLFIKSLLKNKYKKGNYTFDALPEPLKVFQNIEQMFSHLEQIKDTDDLKIVPGGIEISYAISLKIKKKVILALENGVFTNQEKLELEVKQLKNQLKQVLEEKRVMERHIQKSQEQNQKIRAQLNESIKNQKNIKNSSQYLQKQFNQLKKKYLKVSNSLSQSEENLDYFTKKNQRETIMENQKRQKQLNEEMKKTKKFQILSSNLQKQLNELKDKQMKKCEINSTKFINNSIYENRSYLEQHQNKCTMDEKISSLQLSVEKNNKVFSRTSINQKLLSCSLASSLEKHHKAYSRNQQILNPSRHQQVLNCSLTSSVEKHYKTPSRHQQILNCQLASSLEKKIDTSKKSQCFRRYQLRNQLGSSLEKNLTSISFKDPIHEKRMIGKFTKQSNKSLMIQAIKNYCFQNETPNVKLVVFLQDSKHDFFIFLLKENSPRTIRGIYILGQINTRLENIYALSYNVPKQIKIEQVQTFYRYVSKSQRFQEVDECKSFSFVHAVHAVDLK